MSHLHEIKNLDIYTSCRTCLSYLNHSCYDLFATPDLRKKLSVCTSMSVEPDDGYPTCLCEPCHTKIEDFYNFQKMCIISMKRFQDYISSEKNLSSFELPINTNNSPPHCSVPEHNEDQENEYFEFTVTELSNVNDYSSEDIEDLYKFQPLMDKNVNDEDYSCKDNSISNGNEDIIHDVKPAVKKIKTKKMKCKICNRWFIKSETFERHLREHQGLKPFPCEHCEKSFGRRCRLNEHIKDKHEKQFPCTIPGCERILCSKAAIEQHFKDFHCNNINTPKKESFTCEECGKSLTTLASLKDHLYLHTGQQLPYECPQCQKRFNRKNKLKEHINRHDSIGKYVCPHCGDTKSTRPELKKHINTHTKEKTYACQFCSKIFNSVYNLNRHTRVVHEGIRKYQCSFCDKSFGNTDTRKYHEMTHTGEKPNECNICKRRFIQPVALKKHQMTHFKSKKAKKTHKS